MNDKWWLEKGVILVNKETGVLTKIKEVKETCLIVTAYVLDNSKVSIISVSELDQWYLEGVPFDCMPEWTDGIAFSETYEGIPIFTYFNEAGDSATMEYPKCPESWKGKTFTITNELRELLK